MEAAGAPLFTAEQFNDRSDIAEGIFKETKSYKLQPTYEGGASARISYFDVGQSTVVVKEYVGGLGDEVVQKDIIGEYNVLKELEGLGSLCEGAACSPVVYAYGVSEDGHGNTRGAIAMEKAKGDPLWKVMQSGALSERGSAGDKPSPVKVLSIISNLIRGVSAAQTVAIHRDLSDGNIFIDCEDHFRITIIDFGNAVLRASGTLTARHYATPYFGAPEMFETDKHRLSLKRDWKVDMWSVGAIAFYMLTMKYPHKEQIDELKESEFPRNRVQEVKRCPLDLIEALGEDGRFHSDEMLNAWIRKCTEYMLKDRWKSWKDALEELDRIRKPLILDSVKDENMREFLRSCVEDSAFSADAFEALVYICEKPFRESERMPEHLRSVRLCPSDDTTQNMAAEGRTQDSTRKPTAGTASKKSAAFKVTIFTLVLSSFFVLMYALKAIEVVAGVSVPGFAALISCFMPDAVGAEFVAAAIASIAIPVSLLLWKMRKKYMELRDPNLLFLAFCVRMEIARSNPFLVWLPYGVIVVAVYFAGQFIGGGFMEFSLPSLFLEAVLPSLFSILSFWSMSNVSRLRYDLD